MTIYIFLEEVEFSTDPLPEYVKPLSGTSFGADRFLNSVLVCFKDLQVCAVQTLGITVMIRMNEPHIFARKSKRFRQKFPNIFGEIQKQTFS